MDYPHRYNRMIGTKLASLAPVGPCTPTLIRSIGMFDQTIYLDSSSQVEYRNIPELPGYRAGNDGSIWTCKALMHVQGRSGALCVLTDTWKPIALFKHKKLGYFYATLQHQNKKILRTAHRLVLEAFVGPRPAGAVCCHADGNRTNNNLSNLRWDTPKANTADSLRHGTCRVGEERHTSKLSSSQIHLMRQRHDTGECSQRQLAKQFGVSPQTVSRIVRRVERIKSAADQESLKKSQ